MYRKFDSIAISDSMKVPLGPLESTSEALFAYYLCCLNSRDDKTQDQQFQKLSS